MSANNKQLHSKQCKTISQRKYVPDKTTHITPLPLILYIYLLSPLVIYLLYLISLIQNECIYTRDNVCLFVCLFYSCVDV